MTTTEREVRFPVDGEVRWLVYVGECRGNPVVEFRHDDGGSVHYGGVPAANWEQLFGVADVSTLDGRRVVYRGDYLGGNWELLEV